MDPALGFVFISKMYMSNAYMRVYVQPEDVPWLAFLVSPHPGDVEPLVGFHLSVPMGYIESASLFCCTTETVADLANHAWSTVNDAPLNRLDNLADTLPAEDNDTFLGLPQPDKDDKLERCLATLPAVERIHLLHFFDVYVDNFIFLCQGGPAKQRQAQRVLFYAVDAVFCPNDAKDSACKESNSLKKLRLGDATWSTWRRVLT